MLLISGAGVAGLITAGLGCASFSMAGLYCNHADLSPRYAPVLLGLTNTAAAVPGIIGVTITGAILDKTGSWPLALFAPSVVFFVTGSAVFTAWGRADLQTFDNNAPFPFERYFQPLQKPLQGALQRLTEMKDTASAIGGNRMNKYKSQVSRLFKQKQP